MSGTLHSKTGCNGGDLDGSPATALVTIAGSAGAFRGVWRILAELAPDLPAAIAVMLHTAPGSRLASTLAMRSRLVIREAASGDLLQNGYVYVARPQTHLVVNPDARLTISEAPRVGLFRPSADWLFESAAASFPNRHVAVVLSGRLFDGARQLRAVKRSGGTVLVEDPTRAAYREMPAAAIATRCVDAVVGFEQMADAIRDAVAQLGALWATQLWESPFEAGAWPLDVTVPPFRL